MSKAAIFLAEGFEEVEALTVVDVLRRGGVEASMVSVSGNIVVNGAHNIKVNADKLFARKTYDDVDMLILPGGGLGTKNLTEHKQLNGELFKANSDGRYIAAICAAPSVLGLAGFLDGFTAVCYPGFEVHLVGAKIGKTNVVKDRNIITSKGPGTAAEFAIVLLEILEGAGKAEEVRKAMLYKF